MKYYFFEYQIYHSGTGGISFSGSYARYWDGKLKTVAEIKALILLSHNKEPEYYGVRIISAMHLFGEE